MKQIASIFTSPESIRIMSIFAVVITALTCLVQLIRTPPFLKRRFESAVRRCGLHNAQAEYPVLVSAKRDREQSKPHGMILKVRNMGISIPDFDRQCDRLQASLNGIIYGMDYGRQTTYTRIFFLPQKYVHPTLITPDDDAIGRISVRQLINMLIIGPTGTGKTAAIRIIMEKIIKSYAPAVPNIWLLDFKQIDFRGYSGLPKYYSFTDCIRGLNDYYDAFKRQQALGVAGEPNYLIIDEWGSFIMSLDKKQADILKSKLAELLMLGRAYNYFPIIGIQRPDSSYFSTARDNFNACIAISNLSPEARRMVFPDSVAGRLTECHKREGHLYIDGIGLEKIRIADIPDMDALDTSIRKAMLRQSPAGADGDAQREPSDPAPPIGGV